ncbi:Retrovirus-related Pol polyprotein from transposon opus, partial [Mucuna pruriens]
MTFITDSGSFCYKRLMDKIFKDRISHDLEVYVDDMVIKLAIGEQHCEVLRKYKLKLNLEKCSFGYAGRFLGFMLTRRRIEVNLKKCKAVINMRSPRNVKESRIASPLLLLYPDSSPHHQPSFLNRNPTNDSTLLHSLLYVHASTLQPSCYPSIIEGT